MSTESPDLTLRIPTLRDLVAPAFRQKRSATLVALAVFAVALVLAFGRSPQYEAEMKILVKRERVDPLVSGDPNLRPLVRTDVTDDDLNSEVELLKSRDLLQQVAVSAGLHPPPAEQSVALSRVVQSLQSSLRISPIRRTAYIKVTYRATDPATAARVLTELARLYPERHLVLHRPPGTYDFFTKQAERFRQELVDAETRLKEYGRQAQVVSADLERQNTLQRLADFEAALQEARASMRDATRRIAQLTTEAAATPARQQTQVRTSENRELVGQLRSRILGLEVKQAEMLRKFAPSYPPTVEVENELAQARAALARAEQALVTEETTDQNPTHQWLQGELARVRAERAAVAARADSLAASVALYRARARQLDEKATVQQDLTRTVKSAEENYALYRRKQEEARISDALDHTRIVNVAIAETPTIAPVPAGPNSRLLLALGAVVAVISGVGAAYLIDYLTPYLRTPQEVESALEVPVLASLPARR